MRPLRKLTRVLSGIDVTRAAVQIDGSTLCAAFTLARPPVGDFSLRLSLVDTTTFACCATLFFERTAGRLEVGHESLDSQGDRQLERVDDAGARIRGSTLVITGTLPSTAWDQPAPPADEDIAWSLATRFSKGMYGPFFGDWVPRHEPVGQPFVRHRDGTTVLLGSRR